MTQRTTTRRVVAVVAAAGLLVAGCAQTVPGTGRYSSGLSDVPDADVEIRGSDGGSIDRIAGNAVADLERFWTEQMPEVFGRQYRRIDGVFSIDPSGDRAAPCTNEPSDIRGNAFYCPSRDIVAWDRRGLFPDLQRRFGDFLIAMVIAHEWGHVIQQRTSRPSNRTIVVEAQADCYAGAWTAVALKGQAPHFPISRQDLDHGLAGYLLFRDPVGADQDDRQAHGSGFDRISAFQEGFERGAKHCTTFDNGRVFTEVPFTDPRDQANQGNLPIDQTFRLGPADLADFWAHSFERTFGEKWKPVAGIEAYDGERDPPRCDGDAVSAVQYCPADDTIYFDRTDALRKVYDETGDFGPISLIAVAYGQAVRSRLGRTVNGEDALLGSMCLAGGYAGDVFKRRRTGDNVIVLSPGDLDEAVQALLNFAGASGFFDARGTVGFDRVKAFNRGFSDIKACT
jgi:predicted metalloprotease